jgi:type IV secretory pathway VirB2 component (pilin)
MGSPLGSRPRLERTLAFLAVTLVGAWLLWPVPAGHMPLSADHPVHLARAFLTAEQLEGGHLSGWSSAWFFGFPVGELYPPLADLLVIGVRTASLGLLDWWQSYALAFTLGFCAPAWAMLRAGRVFGLGIGPGLIAGLLLVTDPGMYREGGWLYTVGYGVWPQALSAGLTWLGLCELALPCPAGRSAPDPRRIATAALALGASVLAHPMALTTLTMGVPLLVLCRRGDGFRRQLAAAGLAAALGLGIAAFWLIPMLAHRAWMADYGWLFAPLDRMIEEAIRGRWTARMPPAVGFVILAGLAWALVRGRANARFVAALALTSWVVASRDFFWTLRLDRLADGFSHLQWQRFLIAAKPGLFLLAGAAVTAMLHAGAGLLLDQAERRRVRTRRIVGAASVAAAIGAIGWLVVDVRGAMVEHEVGTVQLQRSLRGEIDEDDRRALLDWLARRRAETPDFSRVAFHEPRNVHWFMDSILVTGLPTYKIGFTPGDNFVHKPESGRPELLDRLQVRWIVARHSGGARGEPVARFGDLRVFARETSSGIASVEGSGQLDVLEDDPDGGRVRVRLSGADPSTRLVFHVAGYPRWELSRDGEPVPWLEVPVWGEGPVATPEERRRGLLRGGRAEGDDGSEPTLVAVDGAADGEWVLEYRMRRWFDVLADLISLAAIALCVAAAARRRGAEALLQRLVDGLRPMGQPIAVGAVVALGLGLAFARSREGALHEAARAVGWVQDGRATAERARVEPFKTEMLIRSGVRVRPLPASPAVLEFPGVTLGPVLEGWVAIDDDAAQAPPRGRHRLRIEAREGDAAWRELLDQRVAHRADRQLLAVEVGDLAGRTVALRVTVEASGDAPPPAAFDLVLGPGAPP